MYHLGVETMFHSFPAWFVGWLVGWLAGWWVGWLVGRDDQNRSDVSRNSIACNIKITLHSKHNTILFL